MQGSLRCKRISDCNVFTEDPRESGQKDALVEQQAFDEELRRYRGQEERAALEESIKARLGWR